MSVPDADLVHQAQRGDLAAYAELVNRYRVGMQRYALHLLGNREDAEEALQDSLVRAHRAIRHCRRPALFRAWLTRILVNRCRTRLARGGLRLADGNGDSGLDGISVEPLVDQRAWREEIRRALALLTEDLREAFLLRHVEDFSYDEMAELTGASVSALKMRVSRACEQLRRELQEAYRA